VPAIIRIGREICEALSEAHANGLVHRDIKPANIWLETRDGANLSSGRVKILDFGLARTQEPDSYLTRTDAIVGTPSYMAPEQARAARSADQRSDLFSLGCVLYRLATGFPPFQGDNAMGVLMAAALETPASPHVVNPGLPVPLSDLIVKLLAKNPDHRFPSALAVAKALEQTERPFATIPEPLLNITEVLKSTKPLHPTGIRRSPVRWLVAALLLLGLTGFGWWLSGILLRVETPNGTLIVEIDDDEIQVLVRQKGVTVVDKTTKREFVLKAQDGEIVIFEQGAELTRKSFSMNRGGKTIVSVRAEVAKARESFEPPAEIVKGGHNKANPFIVKRAAGGGVDVECATLSRAFSILKPGDRIEVYGDGPFHAGNYEFRHGLTMKAAPGYRPVFVASEKSNEHQAWFLVRSGPVKIEGCDFHAPNFGYATNMFMPQGKANAPWEFRNCRFLGNASAISFYTGPHLRLEDCLIAGSTSFSSLVSLRPGKSKLEVSNCVIWAHGHVPYPHSTTLLLIENLKGEAAELDVVLRNSTLRSNVRLLPQAVNPENIKIRVVAEGNIFQINSGFGVPLGDVLKRTTEWRAKDNLYVGKRTLAYATGKKKEDIYTGLDAWQDFWGAKEPGSREVDEVYFGWDGDHQVGDDSDKLQAFYRQQLAKLGKLPFPVGPNWDTVGPGQGYVKALAADKRPASPKDLRPKMIEGAPIVLLRKGIVQDRFDKLTSAYAAAQDGDVLEIRTGDPLPGVQLTGAGNAAKRLTIRGAPGYRAGFEGHLQLLEPNLVVTLENLHFRGSLSGYSTKENDTTAVYLQRLANCSMDHVLHHRTPEDRESLFRLTSFTIGTPDGKPGEIVNCVLPGSNYLRVPAQGKLLIRNSLLRGIILDSAEKAPCELVWDHSVLWYVGGYYSPLVLEKGAFAVTVRHSLFEGFGRHMLWLTGGGDVKNWSGTQNVYRLGDQPWIAGKVSRLPPMGMNRPVSSLADWQKFWDTDKDSLEREPLTYDPQYWRLLPGSPGYREGPGKRDFGADVTRIGIVTKAK
jgi:hypothetical protein